MYNFEIFNSLVLLALIIYLLVRILSLRKRILTTKADIQSYRQLIKLAKMSSDHVNDDNLRQANERAELAIRKGQGISNFDCEVRPMLEMVIRSTNRIIDSDITEQERHELSLAISHEVKKLSDLVENVLLMARIESKRIAFSIENLRVADVVMGLYEEYNAQDGSLFSVKDAGGCSLNVIEGRPTLSISADRLYMTKAVREVIKNAFTFSRKGNIIIGWLLRIGTNEVEIFVEDNGVGINPENQRHVFDFFFKDSNADGLGVGLSIAKELVEKMGGKITLVSRPNVGTCVSILFPLAGM